MGFWASKLCRANRNRCAHHHNYCHKRDLISDYTFACTPKPWWEKREMGCWKMVYLDISSSWFDNSGTIDMGKDERKPMHKLCSTIKFHIIWVAYDMQHIYNILKKGNYISNFDIIIASEMRINRCLFFFVVVGIFILFLKMYGLCQRSSLGIPTHFNVPNLNF